MKKWIWKEAAEVIAVLGVIGSMIFVAFEIRENTTATRSAAVQALAEQTMHANSLLVQDANLRAAFLAANSEGVDALTADQRIQLYALYSLAVSMEMNRFTQIQAGVLDEGDLIAARRGSAWQSAFFEEVYWPERRNTYSQQFRVWFENQMAREEPN